MYDEDVVKGSADVSEVKQKGILGLIRASQERKHDKQQIFLLIHINYRKNYIRVDTIRKM